MSIEIGLPLEEPTTTRQHFVPLRVAQVVPEVIDRVQFRVTVFTHEVVDHLAREPVAVRDGIFV